MFTIDGVLPIKGIASQKLAFISIDETRRHSPWCPPASRLMQ
jgi:hypothetical protein